AQPGRIARHEAMTLHPFMRDDHDLAVLDLAHELGADDVERASLRREHPRLAELAEHERPDAVGVARADQLLMGEPDQGISAFDLEQRFDELLDEALFLAARDKMENNLGVGGRLEDGTRLDGALRHAHGM